MTITWTDLALGSLVGTILGAIADWQIGTRLRKRVELTALTKEYASLAGQYVNYHVDRGQVFDAGARPAQAAQRYQAGDENGIDQKDIREWKWPV